MKIKYILLFFSIVLIFLISGCRDYKKEEYKQWPIKPYPETSIEFIASQHSSNGRAGVS